MEQSSCRQSSLHFFCLLLCLSGSVQAYKNYTVGDSAGWYDTKQKPIVNYQKWAAGKPFTLGDFILFNTDTHHSVIQSYNSTTYKNCDFDDALDSDTTEWLAGDPSPNPKPVTVPVRLVKEGATYFFSSQYEGEQCRDGLRFTINVARGKGLPASLPSPAMPSPSPTSPDAGDDDEPAPDTVVSSNFNHPKNLDGGGSSDDGKQSGSVSLSVFGMNRVFILLGLACVFF